MLLLISLVRLSFLGGVVASDVRAWAMRQLKSSGVSATLRHLYPRMLAVHTLPDEVGFPDERGQLVLPRLMRTSYSRMEPHGAYLVENGERAILWLGQAVSPQLLRDLYDVDSLDELDPRKVLPVLSGYEDRQKGFCMLTLISSAVLRSPRSRYCRRGYRLNCGTSWPTSKAVPAPVAFQSCSPGRTSTGPNSSSATCLWKTQTTNR